VADYRGMTGCAHDGFHSGEGRYSPETQMLRYIVVCDACRTELREVKTERYAPSFDPHGNAAHTA
jgi:hypothetical protein